MNNITIGQKIKLKLLPPRFPKNSLELKKNVTTLRTNWIFQVLAILAILVFLGYRGIFGAYFQADEWFFFSKFIPELKSPNGIFLAILKSFREPEQFGFHITPFLNILYYLTFKSFWLNYGFYASLSLILHLINSVLLVIFVYRLTKSKVIGFVSGVFFAISSVHQQAVTWMSAYLGTELAVTFALSSMILFHQLITKKRSKGLWFLFLLFLILSILTKETSFFLLVVIPAIYFLYRRLSIKSFILENKPFILVGVLLVAFRLIAQQLFIDKSLLTPLSPSLVVFRLVAYPLKAFTQVFVPSEFIIKASEVLSPLSYPAYTEDKNVRGTEFLSFTQSAGSDLLIYPIAVMVIFVSALLIWQLILRKRVPEAKSIAIGLLLIAAGSWPLIMIATWVPWIGYQSLLDSRHLYIPSLGASIIFAVFIIYLAEFLNRVSKGHIKRNLLLFLILAIWSLLNLQLLGKEMEKQVVVGSERKMILESISKLYPDIDKKTIFYTAGNMGYYGFGRPMMPFQLNFGHTLLVYYANNTSYPLDFYTSNFLTKDGIFTQAYKASNNHGFGYFLSKRKLFQILEENKLTEDMVVAFYYDGVKKELADITQETKEELGNLSREKKEVAGWKTFINQKRGFSLLYPPNFKLSKNEFPGDLPSNSILEKVQLTSKNLILRIEVIKKPPGQKLKEFVATKKDAGGVLIGKNFKNIVFDLFFGDFIQYVAISPLNTKNREYFVLIHPLPDQVLRFEFQDLAKNQSTKKTISNILKFLDLSLCCPNTI